MEGIKGGAPSVAAVAIFLPGSGEAMSQISSPNQISVTLSGISRSGLEIYERNRG